jgi:hypothetical protein
VVRTTWLWSHQVVRLWGRVCVCVCVCVCVIQIAVAVFFFCSIGT